MLVKVVIDEEGKIYREDNGEVIGRKALFIGYSYWDNAGKISNLHYGYYPECNRFKELCQLTSCSHECLCARHHDCRYAVIGNQGFYYISED